MTGLPCDRSDSPREGAQYSNVAVAVVGTSVPGASLGVWGVSGRYNNMYSDQYVPSVRF